MTDFLDSAIFFFSIAAAIAAIVGHKDAVDLTLFAVAAAMARLAVYIGERLKQKRG